MYSTDEILVNNNLFHSYLLEMTNTMNKNNYVHNFIKLLLDIKNDNKNSYLVDNEIYPEVVYIKAVNNVIKKNQLLEMKQAFDAKPILGKYLIYVIDGAELLNTSAANTMLKFLEDPYDNVIAILLTENKYNVLGTIVSRCQYYRIVDETLPLKNDNENFITVLQTIEQYKNASIAYLSDIYDNLSVEYLKQLIDNFIDIYYDCIKSQMSTREKRYNFVLENNNFVTLSHKIETLLIKKNDLRYNVNLKMFFDRLILDLVEVNND